MATQRIPRAGKRAGSNQTKRAATSRQKVAGGRKPRPGLHTIVAQMLPQMRNTALAVEMTLKLGQRWKRGLPYIAGSAFRDAFAGFCTVYSVKNGRSTIQHMQTAFLAAMRAELESREAAERGRS